MSIVRMMSLAMVSEIILIVRMVVIKLCNTENDAKDDNDEEQDEDVL